MRKHFPRWPSPVRGSDLVLVSFVPVEGILVAGVELEPNFGVFGSPPETKPVVRCSVPGSFEAVFDLVSVDSPKLG